MVYRFYGMVLFHFQTWRHVKKNCLACVEVSKLIQCIIKENQSNQINGIYLSKALTCMKFFLYKQKLLFNQGDGYLWPHCCTNNLYISHRSLNTPTYRFWAIGSMLISLFRVTSWFDTICNIVTRCLNLRENHLHEHELQLADYNI